MKRILPVIIGFLILVIILYFVGFDSVITILSQINLFYFFIAAIVFFVVEILAALKLKLISKLKFSSIFLSHMGGMFLSQITPGRVGYAYTAYSIAEKEKRSISKMIGVIGLVQGVMIASKIFVIVLAFVYFSYISEIPFYLYLAFITPILILFFVVFVLYTDKSKQLLLKIPFLKKTVKYTDLMQEAVKKIAKKTIVYMVLIDLMGWLLYGVMFYFLCISLNVHLSFLTCLMLHPILSALLFIPISPSALGIAESGSALVFSLLKAELDLLNSDIFVFGVAFFLLLRINTIFVDSIGLIDYKNIKLHKILKKIKTKKL